MSTLREAAVMALEALNHLKTREHVDKEIAFLRAALAQPEQEPVAWMDREGDIYPMPEIDGWAPPHTMLYTAPHQREWQELTNEEIEWIKGSANRALGYIRVTAAKLKEKNTAPPQRKPLSEEEIDNCWYQSGGVTPGFARAIERAHGIGGEK